MRIFKNIIFVAFLLLIISCYQPKNRSNSKTQMNIPKDTNEREKFSNRVINTYLPDIINDTNIYDKYIAGFQRKYGIDNLDIWGQGIFSKYRNASEKINFPDSAVNIYNKPNGDIIGKIN